MVGTHRFGRALLLVLGAFIALTSSARTQPGRTTHSYRLMMAGSDIGRARYTIKREDGTASSSLLVTMRLKQAGQATKVELHGALRFKTTDYDPVEYNLVIFSNGAKQADIHVEVRDDRALASVEAPGFGSKDFKLPVQPGTLILDNNFCVDHYQTMLWRFTKSGVDSTTYAFLVPQILLRIQKSFQITLKKVGLDST